MSMDKHDIAKRIYEEGHNFYDYDKQANYNFVSIFNLTQSSTISFTNFEVYELFKTYYGDGADFSNSLLSSIFDKSTPFDRTTAAQRDLAVNVAISSIVSYMAALEALYDAASQCSSSRTSAMDAYDGGVAFLIGSVEGRTKGGSSFQEGRMFYSIAKRNCLHFRNCRGVDAKVNEEIFLELTKGQEAMKGGDCTAAKASVESVNALLKVPLMQSLLYFSDPVVSDRPVNDAAGYVASQAVLPIIDSLDEGAAETVEGAMDFSDPTSTAEAREIDVHEALGAMFSSPNATATLDCDLVTDMSKICKYPATTSGGSSATTTDGGAVTPGTGTGSGSGGATTPTPDEPVIEPEEPMPISNGLYVASNYVGDRSAIALDVAEIQSYLSENDAEGANHTYSHGEFGFHHTRVFTDLFRNHLIAHGVPNRSQLENLRR